MTPQTPPLRADVTPEAVEALLLAADNMPLSREGQPWHGAANWIRDRARQFAARLSATTSHSAAPSQRVEYGLQWDCAANGCAEPCVDEDSPDGVMVRGSTRPRTQRVNSHAVTVVQRTITYSEWEPSQPE